MRWLGVFTICFMLNFAQALATPLTMRSGVQQVHLLELYTSEGCSSCPPADRWISGLKEDPRLWKAVVPVAFHVDYWDYLGWRDRFATTEYSSRQRNYAAKGLVRSVYTPAFILDGNEWRGWFLRPKLRLENSDAVGELTLNVHAGQQRVEADFNTGQNNFPNSMEIHLAVLGFDISTPVRAGENKGRTLTHDFVVLAYDRGSMARTDALNYNAKLSLPTPEIEASKKAIVSWINLPGDPRPIQAVGGWL